jgi:hypothetical protein
MPLKSEARIGYLHAFIASSCNASHIACQEEMHWVQGLYNNCTPATYTQHSQGNANMGVLRSVQPFSTRSSSLTVYADQTRTYELMLYVAEAGLENSANQVMPANA